MPQPSTGSVALRLPSVPLQEDVLWPVPIVSPTGLDGRSLTTHRGSKLAGQRT